MSSISPTPFLMKTVTHKIPRLLVSGASEKGSIFKRNYQKYNDISVILETIFQGKMGSSWVQVEMRSKGWEVLSQPESILFGDSGIPKCVQMLLAYSYLCKEKENAFDEKGRFDYNKFCQFIKNLNNGKYKAIISLLTQDFFDDIECIFCANRRCVFLGKSDKHYNNVKFDLNTLDDLEEFINKERKAVWQEQERLETEKRKAAEQEKELRKEERRKAEQLERERKVAEQEKERKEAEEKRQKEEERLQKAEENLPPIEQVKRRIQRYTDADINKMRQMHPKTLQILVEHAAFFKDISFASKELERRVRFYNGEAESRNYNNEKAKEQGNVNSGHPGAGVPGAPRPPMKMTPPSTS